MVWYATAAKKPTKQSRLVRPVVSLRVLERHMRWLDVLCDPEEIVESPPDRSDAGQGDLQRDGLSASA